jgi:hypothetical protein
MAMLGGCLCRAVRFESEADPLFQVKCYCTDCRRTSGSGHAAMMGFDAAKVRIKGAAKEFRSKADSGNDVSRAFCPTCGAGIYSKVSARPNMIFLRASALDDPSAFAPQIAVWAARAPRWDPVSAGLPAFDLAPPAADAAER